MTRFSIPPWLRLAFICGAAFTLLLALRFESDYRNRLNHLPSLVDEHGNTSSVETAIAGLEAHERAKQIRRFGFLSLGAGALLAACAVVTKSRSKPSQLELP